MLVFFLAALVAGWGCEDTQEAVITLGDPLGKVEKVDGDVLVLRAGAKGTVHLHLGDPLTGGDVITTETGGTATVKMGAGLEVLIRSGSRVQFNHRLLGPLEVPSLVLQRGRVSIVSGDSSLGNGPCLETPTMTFQARGTEFEVGVAEDLGVLVAVARGNLQVVTPWQGFSLKEKQELEVDFLEGPLPLRPSKERTEADWAGWMAARFRNLSMRLPEIAARVDRSLRETASARVAKRTELEQTSSEMEVISKELDAGKTDGNGGLHRSPLWVKLVALAKVQAASILELRHLANRTESLLIEAERLQTRASNLKNELGDRWPPVDHILRSLLENGRLLRSALKEERTFLLACGENWRSTMARVGAGDVFVAGGPPQSSPAAKPVTQGQSSSASSKIEAKQTRQPPKDIKKGIAAPAKERTPSRILTKDGKATKVQAGEKGHKKVPERTTQGKKQQATGKEASPPGGDKAQERKHSKKTQVAR